VTLLNARDALGGVAGVFQAFHTVPLGFTCQAGWLRGQDVSAGASPGSLGDLEDM